MNIILCDTVIKDFIFSLQVIVQKITVLAFSIHDGLVKHKEELNEIQKREALL